MMPDRTALPDWVSGAGPEADVILSTRARLARNLASFPFPERAEPEELAEVARLVRSACTGLMKRFPGLKSLRVERLTDAQRSFLLDARVASAEQIRGGEGRIVITDPGGRLSVMVNEEDHLRIQAILPGLAPHDAWELVDWADDELAAKLDYGFSERYGFLTASVSNVGTGLRVSAMMHLAGLAMTRRLNERLRAAGDLGVSVRGAFGERSRAAGNLYQVSNEVTLGLPESEIVERVRSVAQYLLGEERRAREELMDDGGKRPAEEAKRALEKLSGLMSVRSAEALGLISRVRLAAAMGLVDGCDVSLANELIVGVGAAAGDEPVACIERAAVLRRKVRSVRAVS